MKKLASIMPHTLARSARRNAVRLGVICSNQMRRLLSPAALETKMKSSEAIA